MEFTRREFCGSNALWDYVMVNASLRSYIVHHDQSGLSRPNHMGKRDNDNAIFTSAYNKRNVSKFKLRKAINLQ
jgi:hypothetical protein